MKKTLAIIGSGHLGQQIAHFAISDNHYEKVVFFDDINNAAFEKNFPIIGTSNDIEKEFNKNSFHELIIGIGYKHLSVRKSLFEKFENKIPFGKIVHTSCWVDNTAIIKKGTVVYPNCDIDANTVINENTVVNIACTIAHDTSIGKHCFLSPRVALAGFVSIAEMCIIGINATIIDNISVISNTQIGGGTVVIKDLIEQGLYVGNPQRFIR